MSTTPEKPTDERSSKITWILALLGTLASIFYLANPGWGVLEFLPDNLPGIGNIDETVITGFLIACLARLGINVIPGLGRNRRRDTIVDPVQKNSDKDSK